MRLHEIACPPEIAEFATKTRLRIRGRPSRETALCFFEFDTVPTNSWLRRGARRFVGRLSVHPEIPIDLPRRDVLDVVEPLLALCRHEVLECVLAERVANQIAFFELVGR